MTDRSSKPNPLSTILNSFINKFQLTPVDLTIGTGPNYSYHHLTLPNSSYIDHVLILSNLLHVVAEIKIIEPHYTNTR